jgi:protein-tyrosine phosphatase
MTDFCSTSQISEVPDPYYGGNQGFENVLDILEDACQGLLEYVTAK